MTESMESKLARLPEPAPPAALAATVMARIARAPTHDSATADRRARRPETESILGGLWAFIGAVLVGVVVVQRWLAAGFASELVSSRIGDGGLVLVPLDGWTSLVLCAGLVLYLLGLFAPLRRVRV